MVDPALSAGCLPGVERGRLLELRKITERVLTLADLRRAEEIAVLNSLRGWRSAVLTSPSIPFAIEGKLEHPSNGPLESCHVAEREPGRGVAVAPGDRLEQLGVVTDVLGQVGQLVDHQAPDPDG